MKYSSMMTQWRTLALSAFIALVFTHVSIAVTIWSEDFSSYATSTGIDGTGTLGDYPDDVSKWSLNTNGCTLVDAGDYVKIVNEKFEFCDTDGEAVWSSELIDISDYDNVGASCELTEYGGLAGTEYIRVYFKLDGGSETLFVDGDQTDDMTPDDGPVYSSASALDGNSLQIIVKGTTSYGTRQTRIDNILVTGTPTTVPTAPTNIATTLIKANEFTVTWSEVSTATNYAIDVSTVSNFVSYTGGFHDTLTGTDESVTITGLTAETSYAFRLRAMNAAGNSSYSATNSETTTAAVSPLSAGDIYFTGYNAATNEDLAFALFEDVGAGTTLHFSNGEWNGLEIGSGGALSTGGEAFSWYSGAALLNAGTVVVFSDLGNASRSTSVGSLMGDTTSLNVSGDAIFCFYGSDSNTPTEFLAGVCNGTVVSTYTNLTGTGLIENDTALVLSSGTSIGAYTNARTGFTKAQFKSMLVDDNNWIRQTDGNINGYDGIAPDAPFSTNTFTFATPSSLSAGDIAFVGFDSADDEFAFVTFVDLPLATTIIFTDNNWNTNTSSFAVNEGSGTWKAASTISAGTVITNTLGGSASSGTWSQSGTFALAADGDPILAYQGTAENPTFIAGIRAGSWSSTELPSSLTLGLSALRFGNIDSCGYFLNIKTTGTVEALKTAINNEAAWYYEDGDVTFPNGSFSIQSNTPTLVAGDIAFIAYDLESDRFAFVAMTNIAEDTEIAFTDIGWDKTDLVPDVDINVLEEHTAVWTAPAGGLNYGDVIQIQGTTVAGGGTISGSLNDLLSTGDHILAFQGSVTNPTFIAAISMYSWRTGADVVSEAKHSHLPSTLTEGQTAVQPTSSGENHGRYIGERIGVRATLLPSINTAAYWQVSDTGQTWLSPWRFTETPFPTLFKFQ